MADTGGVIDIFGCRLRSWRTSLGVSTVIGASLLTLAVAAQPTPAQSAPTVSSQIVDENGNPVTDPPVASTTLLQISIPVGATTKPPKAKKATTTVKATAKRRKAPAQTTVVAAESTSGETAAPSTGSVKVGKPSEPTSTGVAGKGVDASITTVLPPDQLPNQIADEVWLALRKCESNNRYDINTGNGYYGAYQFAAGTWRNLGYTGLPHRAAPAVQDEAAKRLQAKAGWGPWPACTRKLGLR
jgi:hypothetical protein